MDEPEDDAVLAADEDSVESPPAFAGDPDEAADSEVDDEPLPADDELPVGALPRLSVR